MSAAQWSSPPAVALWYIESTSTKTRAPLEFAQGCLSATATKPPRRQPQITLRSGKPPNWSNHFKPIHTGPVVVPSIDWEPSSEPNAWNGHHQKVTDVLPAQRTDSALQCATQYDASVAYVKTVTLRVTCFKINFEKFAYWVTVTGIIISITSTYS